MKIYIDQINSKINLLSVCLGLIISILVLLIGAVFFGGYALSGITNVSLYIGTVLLLMAFFGSIVTGILGDKKIYEGSINGAFLSLIILILTTFTLGILIFVFIGMYELISSALSSFASTSTATSTTSGNTNYFTIINFVELIIFLVLFFISGMLGGAIGVFLKQGIKKIKDRTKG